MIHKTGLYQGQQIIYADYLILCATTHDHSIIILVKL